MADAPAARARLPRQRRRRKRCAGCTLKQELSLEAVGAQLGVSSSVARRRLIAAGVARRPSFQTRYPRRDFSGEAGRAGLPAGIPPGRPARGADGAERGGQVHQHPGGAGGPVRSPLRAVRARLHQHGHTRLGAELLKRAVRMQVGLNRTFEFLVPKEDRVPEWVLAGDEAFYAYFAGYLDAEGYVKAGQPLADGQPEIRVEIRSYDRQTLRQLGEGLNKRGIRCPPAALCVRAGLHQQARRAQQRGPVAASGSGARMSLQRLFERIDPYRPSRTSPEGHGDGAGR